MSRPQPRDVNVLHATPLVSNTTLDSAEHHSLQFVAQRYHWVVSTLIVQNRGDASHELGIFEIADNPLHNCSQRAPNRPMKSSSGTSEAALLGLLFFAASIVRGGNRQIAIALLLLISLVLLSVILADLTARRVANNYESASAGNPTTSSKVWPRVLLGIVLLAPLYICLIQASPILPPTWPPLADDTVGPLIRGALPPPPYHSHVTMSAVPDVTVVSALCGLIMSIALWATMRLRTKFISLIVFTWMLIAAIQVAMVVLQLSGGPGSWAYFNSDYQQYKFIGTFNSRNTLGGFFALCMPLVVWYTFFQQGSANRPTSFNRARGSFGTVVLTGMTLLVLGMQSRGGLLAFLASALAMVPVIWMTRSKQPGRSWEFTAILLGLGLVFALVFMFMVGWETVTQRFRLEEVGRPILFSTAWDGAMQLWPLGAGLGTFGAVYPKFQPAELPGYFSLAHNDYIQYVFELGLTGVFPAVALLALTISAITKMAAVAKVSGTSDRHVVLGLCALASLFALLFHSAVEFNMHIPMMTLFAVFLIGIILKPLVNENGQ